MGINPQERRHEMPHVKPWRLAKSVEPGRFRHWRISWPPLAWPREADLIPLLRYGIDPESGTNLGYYQLLIRFLNGMILQVDIILSKQTNTHTNTLQKCVFLPRACPWKTWLQTMIAKGEALTEYSPKRTVIDWKGWHRLQRKRSSCDVYVWFDGVGSFVGPYTFLFIF